MDLDCLFPAGTGGVEAHLESLSVIFAVGSEETLGVCIYLCPLHLLHSACGALEDEKYSGNVLRPQVHQPALGGFLIFYSRLWWGE